LLIKNQVSLILVSTPLSHMNHASRQTDKPRSKQNIDLPLFHFNHQSQIGNH